MKREDVLLGGALVLMGVLTRTIFHLGANIEFVTLAGIIAGYYFINKAQAMAVPILILAISDLIIGNSSIMIFTWSGFLLAPVLGAVLRQPRLEKIFARSGLMKLLGFGGAATISVIFFFLWTNLGVVLLTSMYPNTLAGIGESYVNALPFLRNQLVGNGVGTILAVILIEAVCSIQSNHKAFV